MFDAEEYKKGFRDGYKQGLTKASAIRPAAYWVPVRVDKRHYKYLCFNCGCQSKYKKSNYCPDCGFEMSGRKGGKEWST